LYPTGQALTLRAGGLCSAVSAKVTKRRPVIQRIAGRCFLLSPLRVVANVVEITARLFQLPKNEGVKKTAVFILIKTR